MIGEPLGEAYRETRRNQKIMGDCGECEDGELKIIVSKRTSKRFAGCTNYPDCNNSFPLPQNGKIVPMGEECDDCGEEMEMWYSARNYEEWYCEKCCLYHEFEDDELVPITRFVDVEGFMEKIEELSDKDGILKNVRIAFSLIKDISDFIDEEKSPEGVDVNSLIVDAIRGGDYNSLGEFHQKSLYIGSMWFQDAWNLNMDRLSRCVIHYATPEGIVPFCTYNGLNVGPKIREKHSIPVEEWEEKTGKEMRDDLWDGGPIS